MTRRHLMVYAMVGLPGSGKTHRAREILTEHLASGGRHERLVRISRDDYRQMLTVGYRKPMREFEEVLTRLRNAAIAEWLNAGADVIVDEMNLNPAYRTDLACLAARCGARCELVDFRHVPLETCIARDAERTGFAHVGEWVIRDLHARYIVPCA